MYFFAENYRNLRLRENEAFGITAMMSKYSFNTYNARKGHQHIGYPCRTSQVHINQGLP